MTTETRYLQAILSEYSPRCLLLSVAVPDDGMVNRVLFLNTTCGELVLKQFDDTAGSWKPQKERAINAHLQSLGIPAPVVYRLDTSRRFAPFVYSLAERAPGTTWSRTVDSLSEEENCAIYAHLGNYLGKMHSSTFSQFGEIHPAPDGLRVGPGIEADSPAGPFATWRECHDEIVRERLRLMRGTAFEDLTEAVAAWFASHQAALDYPVVPRLLHMDLHRGIILIANGQISAILDVEEFIVGHNEYDLMRTELAHFRGQNPLFQRAFMQSYEAIIQLDPGYESRKQFYDVSRTLAWIQSLILLGNRGTPSQSAARSHLNSLIG